MAVDVTQREIPDEKLFRRWRQSDKHARDEIFEALWYNLTRIGFHYCSAPFRFYREHEVLSEDVARAAFVQIWESLNSQVLAGKFEWRGASKFHSYCHTAYRHALIKHIRKQHQRSHTETSFDLGSDSQADEDDSGHKRNKTSHELVALVHDFSVVAQRLHDRGQAAEAEIANLIVLYVKCEVARHSETFGGSANADLPVDQIAAEPIKKLLAGVPADRQLEIGLEADSQAFRAFLMQQLCDFKLSDDMRAKYCEVLQVEFTIKENDGRRRRITQAELMQAHKNKRRETPKDPLVDEAYQALTDFLRNRALVDQRWGRFKKAYEALWDEM